jgi:hypothetical protein
LVVFAPFGSYHVDVLERLAIDALNWIATRSSLISAATSSALQER